MAHKHDLHVMPLEGRWKIVRPNQSDPVATSDTQEEAIHLATHMQYDDPDGGEVVIHAQDGTIRERSTINRHDPFPPPG